MISIVVPARDERDTIGRCLEALLAQEGLSLPVELIVVDDGSADGTADEVRSLATREGRSIAVIAGPGTGVSAARNAGAAAARGDLLLFTDADCRPVPGWATALVAAVTRNGVSGATGRQRTDQRALVSRLVQAEYDEKHARLAGRTRVTFADTASVAYRAEAFRAVGGFDESLRNFEDTELAFRLAEAGHRLVVVPEAGVHHRHATGLWEYARRKHRIGFWGAVVYRAHPDKVVEDSRTPWAMRAQMLLAPAAVLAAGLGLLRPGGWRIAAGLLLAFLVSTVPFARHARRQGADALLAAPAFLFLRALALDAGLMAGLLRLLAGSHPVLRALERPRQASSAGVETAVSPKDEA